MNEEMLNERKNHFCVISVATCDLNGYKYHLIETSSSWNKNPYETGYAVVPDDMVEAIMETRGFCDIVLNEEGTEVVSFVPREIPDIPVPVPEPTGDDVWAELDKAYQEGYKEGVNSI